MVLWGRLEPGLEIRGPRHPRQPLVESRNQSVCFLEDEYVQLSVEVCWEAACIYKEEKTGGDFCSAYQMEGISVVPNKWKGFL